MTNPIFLSALALSAVSALPMDAATVAVGAAGYTQNFDSLVAGTAPATGWSVRTGATETGMGTAQSMSVTARDWTNAGGSFKNASSTNIAETSTAQEQLENTDRALAVTQTTFGNYDPGAAFSFNFSTTGVVLNTISIDMLVLKENTRTSSFEIQYGLGTTPASFTTLATWSSGGFGGTDFTFDDSDFGTALDGQEQVWFRVVALDATTGTGTPDMVGIDDFSINASAVPEPSAVVLLSALGVLGLVRRR